MHLEAGILHFLTCILLLQVRIQARRDLDAARQQWTQERDKLVAQHTAAMLKVSCVAAKRHDRDIYVFLKQPPTYVPDPTTYICL